MALNLMPLKNFWAIIFYIMMLSLGVDTMFAFFEYIGAAVEEYFPDKREILRMKIIGIYIFFGIIYCFGNGFYLTIFADEFISFNLIVSALFTPVFFVYFKDIKDLNNLILKETGDAMSYMNVIKYISIPFLSLLLLISFPLTV